MFDIEFELKRVNLSRLSYLEFKLSSSLEVT